MTQNPPTTIKFLDHAQLGNHSLAPLAVYFVASHPHVHELDPAELPVIRSIAADVLSIAVAPGMIGALQEALTDSLTEVRRHALKALFYLGTTTCAEATTWLLDDPDLAENARINLHGLVGAPMSDSSEEVRSWWLEHRVALPAGYCLRFGQPIWLPDVIEQMRSKAGLVSQLAEELRIRTGENFLLAADPATAAAVWWEHNATRFGRGALHKYGYCVPIPPG